MMNPKNFQVEVQVQIPFFEIDSMEVMWHGNYFKYFEMAREKLLSSFGYGYREMKASGYMWPIVDTRVQYRGAVIFEQLITIRATLLEYENRLKIGYEVIDTVRQKRLTTAYTVQVPVKAGSQELEMQSPAILLESLQAHYPATLSSQKN